MRDAKEALDYIRANRDDYAEATDRWVLASGVRDAVHDVLPLTVAEVEDLLDHQTADW